MKTRNPKNPTVTIIICLHIISDRFYNDLKKFLQLKYKDYELIIVTNKNADVKHISLPHRLIIPKAASISLGEKRDLGIQASRGKYCAFIDDDAYPDQDWLTNAIKDFQSDKTIGAVGGPNCTPQEDGFWEKIGGLIYESYLTSGQQQSRFIPLQKKEVLELQGVNLILRKDILSKLGGFRHKLYSGDDSKICGEMRSLGYKILYDPAVKVYHHRRPFPWQHLRQIRNMGTHRGFFVKAHPETLAPIYFVPTLLASGFLGGLIMCIFIPMFRLTFLILFIAFYLLGLYSARRSGLMKAGIVSFGVMLTHIVYGINFVKGLFLNSVERKN